MKTRHKKKRGSFHERWAAVIADIDIDLETSVLDPRLAFLLRVGWRARHRDLVRRLEMEVAREMKHLRGALTYDDFKAWRLDLVKRGKAEVVRLENRLTQIRAMENPTDENPTPQGSWPERPVPLAFA